MYPQHHGGGTIAVTTKYFWAAFLLGLFKPEISVNGYVAARAWGRTEIPVPPGQHHLHVHVPYLLPSRIGSADLGVTVQPGQVVEVEYRAPTIAFIDGAIGPPPQKYPGMVVTWILLAVSALILLCGCGGILLAALSSGSTGP
ncbi:hypothetical protein [Actinoplanes sp. N902-109]|uniref:hypothetical protein n=1 Tax=Actinoplanes sp. (strain N902-109) TaxID=649831 RepID=UPI0003293FF9|nr:hypothetical protein [Actinoplanes sp. N902-109]AGL18876.1 hypothetical protein L083_5366 [Actinoplanes sp. N902-109]